MRKNTLALLLLTASLCTQAATPTETSIETLLTLAKAEALVETMFGQIENSLHQGMAKDMADMTLNPAQQRILASVPTQFMTIAREELSWAKIKPVYVGIYQESLTQEDVDGMISFYRSPAGEAMVNKMPVVMQKTMLSIQTLMQPLMARVGPIVEKAKADAKLAK